MNFKILPVTAIMVLCIFGTAHADTGANAQLVERAKAALSQRDYRSAGEILSEIDPHQVDRNELDFLNGTLALSQGRFSDAVDYFRSILRRDPALVRVRLEMARSLFLKGDDDAAEAEFRAASATDLPPAVRRNVESYLTAIKKRRHWSLSVSAGLAPDSNVNGATSARTVEIVGLPFTLSEDARQKSGVGFTSAIGGSYRFYQGEFSRLELGGQSVNTDYKAHEFDDNQLSIYVGPRFVWSRYELGAFAVGGRRWYGGDEYSYNTGGRMIFSVALSPRMVSSSSAEVADMKYDIADDYNGQIYSFAQSLSYNIDTQSLIRVTGSLSRTTTRVEAYDNDGYGLSLGYYRQLPAGFSVYAEVAANGSVYQARELAFSNRRHDLSYEEAFTVSNDTFTFLDFVPGIKVTHVSRNSTVDLYDYQRTRLELTVTKSF